MEVDVLRRQLGLGVVGRRAPRHLLLISLAREQPATRGAVLALWRG